jgi:STE24 endopeptidase
MDASARSAHSNAYFYGFFKNKRVVLFDTLLEQVDEDGIVAILGIVVVMFLVLLLSLKTFIFFSKGHEFGHYKMNHVLKNILITQIYLLGFLFLFGQALNNDALYAAFGFETEKPVFIGLVRRVNELKTIVVVK